MKKSIFLALLLCISLWATGQKTIVEKYGHLHVKGTHVFSEKGDTVQLRGMSLFWSQWMGQYYTPETVKWLKDDWKCTVVRAAMGVDMGGYGDHPEDELKKVHTVVDASIKEGLYVVIDYHSHEAHKNVAQAKKFFSEMAQKYGSYPNVLYEIYNEPLQEPSWEAGIKPYSEEVVKAIRQYDPDNLIIIGTRQWSQRVNEAASNPLEGSNLVYSLHYYAGTHKQWLREEAEKAMSKGVALFVSEYGTCDASGNGGYNEEESKTWWQFLDKHKISWCTWAISDKEETASALVPGASGKGGWKNKQLTKTGKFVRNEIVTKNKALE